MVSGGTSERAVGTQGRASGRREGQLPTQAVHQTRELTCTYLVAFSTKLEPDDPTLASEEINQLSGKLLQEGWEVVGRGQYWYSLRFGRKLQPRQQVLSKNSTIQEGRIETPPKSSGSEVGNENCDVRLKYLGGFLTGETEMRFEAWAFGSRGRYCAAYSGGFLGFAPSPEMLERSPAAIAALNDLVYLLTHDGWVLPESPADGKHGGAWYQRRLSR
ncbi:MAG: hypothetical protein ACYDAR_04300, partial [Thermomicrobiales bacterium]